jgi:hypothetical protein
LSAVLGTSALLVLLGGPAFADDPPVDGECSFVTLPPAEATDEPVDEPTTEPTDQPTTEPGETVTAEPGGGDAGQSGAGEATGEPTLEATDEPTGNPTDEPTLEPTEEPTDEPTADPTEEPGPEPTGYYVCVTPEAAGGPLAGEQGDPTLGSGDPQLPFSGAPVGRYLATGLGLVLAGTGTVLVARRRVS